MHGGDRFGAAHPTCETTRGRAPDRRDHALNGRLGQCGNATRIEDWRSSLTLAPQTIARDPVYCAEDGKSAVVLGVSHFDCLNDEEVYLDRHFVKPAAIRRGVGSVLWRYVIEQARAAGGASGRVRCGPARPPILRAHGCGRL